MHALTFGTSQIITIILSNLYSRPKKRLKSFQPSQERARFQSNLNTCPIDSSGKDGES